LYRNEGRSDIAVREILGFGLEEGGVLVELDRVVLGEGKETIAVHIFNVF
jgi:hypothetical protein